MIAVRRYGQLMLVLTMLFAALAAIVVRPPPSQAATECRSFTLDKDDRLQFSALDNASGMVASKTMDGVFWAHNDQAGGSPNTVFAMNALGQRLATINFNLSGSNPTVPGDFVDLEDIAVGPGPVVNSDYLYIADTGDNDRNRPEVAVYRFLEPQFTPNPGNPQDLNVSEADIEGQRFTYAQIGDPTKTWSRDAEAIIIDPEGGDLFIFEKGTHTLLELGEGQSVESAYSLVFRIERPKLFVGSGVRTASIVSHIRHRYEGQQLDGSRITAADISHDGHTIALRNDEKLVYWYRSRGQTVENVFDVSTDAPCFGPDDTRGEALAILADGSAFYSLREGADPLLSPIFRAERTDFTTIECDGIPATIVGTNAAEFIKGTDGRDVIVSLGGKDRINAGAGNDLICAGSGHDIVNGGSGNDIIFGRSGRDRLSGGSGVDRLYGGMNGDTLTGGSGDDLLLGGEHADDIEGNRGLDTLKGGRAADELRGGDDDDTIRGSGGPDELVGGVGIDDCDGGAGTDDGSSCENESNIP